MNTIPMGSPHEDTDDEMRDNIRALIRKAQAPRMTDIENLLRHRKVPRAPNDLTSVRPIASRVIGL